MKKTVAVVFGGASSEYEISLMSASFILRSISQEKYNIRTIGITREGHWYLYHGNVDQIENGTWINDPQNVPAILSPDRNAGGLIAFYPDSTQMIAVDVVFPVLHGKNGEDGTIQGLLTLSGIPYVGCNTISSAICMDKAITHSLLTAAGIEQAHYLWFYADRFVADPQRIKQKIAARFTFPVFVKPANAGSSVGVSKVTTLDALDAAIAKAAKEDIKIVVEQGIMGQEVECAVLGNREPMASTVGEIGATAEFYDYDDKYKTGTSQTFIPARLDPVVLEQVRSTAIRAYRHLGCAGLARVDFFVTPENHVILNEINTIPGFTSISMYPKLWMSSGMNPTALMDCLLDSAFTRYE